MAHQLAEGVRGELVPLPGKKSGWACRIIVGRTHKATVADPENLTKDGALWAAKMWIIMYKPSLA